MTGAAGKSAKRMGAGFVGGAAFGFLAVMGYKWLGGSLDMEGMHHPALLVALMLAAIGLLALGGSLTAKTAARLHGQVPEPGEDLSEERRSLRWQGIVTLLAAVELVVLALRTDILTGPASRWLFAGLMVLLVVQTWINVRLWRSGDELFRRVIIEAAVIGAVVFQFGLFLWAAAARFAFVPDPSALDVYVAMMVLYLIGSGIAATRRGYGQPN